MRKNLLPGSWSGMLAAIRAAAHAIGDRTGVAVIDYALLAGLIALVAVTALQMAGSAVADMYDVISSAFVESLAPTP